MNRLMVVVLVMMLFLTSCNLRQTTPLDDGNVDVSAIIHNISSYQTVQSEENIPQTLYSYNQLYSLNISKDWRLEEKGTLSNDESTVFELSYMQGGSVTAVCQATETVGIDAAGLKAQFLSELTDEYTEEVTEQGIAYVRFTRVQSNGDVLEGYYAFFVQAKDNSVRFLMKYNAKETNNFLTEFTEVINGFAVK